jgi:hypothetical protein
MSMSLVGKHEGETKENGIKMDLEKTGLGWGVDSAGSG